MLTFRDYKRLNTYSTKTNGQLRKHQSDIVMESTWNEDPQSKIAYLYDWYHDDEPLKLRDLKPQTSKVKVPIEIKYIVNASQTFDKDAVTYHLQMKPSQECNVNYYNEFFADRYDAIFPVGLYIDIPDNKDRYNRWLVVEKANYYDPQFSTFEILPCDYVFQWMIDGKKYQMPGVLRSQNS